VRGKGLRGPREGDADSSTAFQYAVTACCLAVNTRGHGLATNQVPASGAFRRLDRVPIDHNGPAPRRPDASESPARSSSSKCPAPSTVGTPWVCPTRRTASRYVTQPGDGTHSGDAFPAGFAGTLPRLDVREPVPHVAADSDVLRTGPVTVPAVERRHGDAAEPIGQVLDRQVLRGNRQHLSVAMIVSQ
jgi:hypothetical protein